MRQITHKNTLSTNIVQQKNSVGGQKLPLWLRDVVVGKLLGDSGASVNTHITKASIKVSHGGPGSLIYTLYCYLLFSGVTVDSNRLKFFNRFDKRYQKWYNGYTFTTHYNEMYIDLVKQFYPDIKYGVSGKKVVPKDIWELLTPKALALWIMDDGGSTSNSGIYISTEGFSYEDVHLLWIVLTFKYGLKVSISKRKKIINIDFM